MTKELPVFAVNRNEIFRSHELQQDFHFFLTGVSGDVNRRRAATLVIHQYAAAEEMVNHPEYRFFVSGNDARRQNYRIVFRDAHEPVVIHGYARKRRKWLRLRSAG